jgi:hypothetical protein
VASTAAPQTVVESAPEPRETPAPAPEPVLAEANTKAKTADSRAARTATENEANHPGEGADDHAISTPEMADEEGEGIVRKRRGIRLKQDLN